MASATSEFPVADRSLPLRRPVGVLATRHAQRDAVVLGNLRLRYVDVEPEGGSTEGPPLVLLHGLASRIEEYEALIDGLRDRRRIVVMDLPGNGYSDKPARAYTLAFLEDAVLALLDRLGVAEADLAGGSLGGNLVLRLGHRVPQRFRKLVPWAPGGAWEPMRVLAWLGRCVARVGRATFWPSVWIQSRFWYESAWPGRARALQDAFAHFREIHVPPFTRMYFELACEQLATSLFPIAPAIHQPTLVLWGDRDHALGMGHGVKRLASLLPSGRLVVLPGVRHALANEVPQVLARHVDAFLREGVRVDLG
jgi:pimeloyl-ACP methyl ester carboxylesterase